MEVKISLEKKWCCCYLASPSPKIRVLRTCFRANHHHHQHRRHRYFRKAYESTASQAWLTEAADQKELNDR